MILDSKLVQEQNLKLQNFEKKVFFISLNGKMFQGAARLERLKFSLTIIIIIKITLSPLWTLDSKFLTEP